MLVPMLPLSATAMLGQFQLNPECLRDSTQAFAGLLVLLAVVLSTFQHITVGLYGIAH
jgi:hypothetical protein